MHTNRLSWNAALLGLCCAVCAAGAPKVRIVPESLDFGNVKAGTTSEKTVTIYNDGDAPLTVLRAKASCGCTSIDAPDGDDRIIKPGESKPTTVRFNSTGKIGKQSAVAVITTNDPDRPAVTINVTAVVENLTILRPPSGLQWGQAPRGETIRRTVVIVPGTATDDIDLISIASNTPALTPTAAKVTRNRQQMIDVAFALSKDAPLGELIAHVEARVRVGGNDTTVAIPARGLVVGDVTVAPVEIRAMHAVKRGGLVGDIFVRASRGGPAPEIVSLDTTGPVRAEVAPVRGEDERRIAVTAAIDAPGGPNSAMLYIMTSAADQPIVKVPIYFDTAGFIDVTPAEVLLDSAHPTQRIELRSKNHAPFTVSNLKFDERTIRASVITSKAEDDSPAVIEISSAEATISFPRGILLIIETSAPGDGAIAIPVLLRP